MSLQLKLLKTATCPLNVQVRNPDLHVSIKAFSPELDPVEGLWYCDLKLGPTLSYFEFIQFGLARYQEHCAPHLQLSSPRAAFAQVPAKREGSVTFNKDRTIVVEHHGVGYGTSATAADPAVLPDVPLLNLRLLVASHPGTVAHGVDGSISWLPVLDVNGSPVHKLRVRPHTKDKQVWWCEQFQLPVCRPGIRYGLQIEEVELLDADPEPTVYPERWKYNGGVVAVELIKVERTIFLHVVDLGE
jgi:hypothetical protein